MHISSPQITSTSFLLNPCNMKHSSLVFIQFISLTLKPRPGLIVGSSLQMHCPIHRWVKKEGVDEPLGEKIMMGQKKQKTFCLQKNKLKKLESALFYS